MGIVPVLFVIMVIASVVANYRKAAQQRILDEKRRLEKRKKADLSKDPREEIQIRTQPSVQIPPYAPAVKKKGADRAPSAKPHVSLNRMRDAVIMAEILNKPVSLRDK